MKIIVAPIPTPSQYALDLPPALDAWWARASQRDPAQRFNSAKELCDGLALVFGRSGSDVGEHAPFGGGFGGTRPGNFGATPQRGLGMTPQRGFGMTPQGLGTTPQRGLGPHGPTPSQGAYGAPHYGNTRQPTFGGGHQGAQQTVVDASTGAPIATTFGAVAVPGMKSRTAMLVAIAAVLGLVGAAIAGVSVAMRGKAEPVAAASGAAVPAVTPGVDAQAAQAPLPTAALAAAPPETITPPPAPPPAANPVPPPAAKPNTAFGKGPAVVRPPPVVKPPPPAGPTPEKKKPIDLGI
jgi:serine/threonine-protein kinase